MRLPVGVLIASLVLTACTTQASSNDEAGETPDWTAFNSYAADLPTVEVRTDRLPRPPEGFTAKQVQVFAQDAVDLLQRSISNKVATMGPDAATRYVTDEQYPATTYAQRSDMARIFAGSHWEWNVASLLTAPPSRAGRIVKVAWNAGTRQGTLANGTKAPILDLALQAHIVHTIGRGQDRRSFIVRRSIKLSGYKPGGGPNYWPYLTMRSTTWGNNGCSLLNTAKLVPLKSRTTLASDLAAAKISISEAQYIAENDMNSREIRDYLDACDKRRHTSK